MMIATENPLSNRNVKLYLSSYDGEGVIILYIFFILFYPQENFLKILCTDFSRNSIALEKMQEFVKNLKNLENYVQVIVEVKNSGLSENDFILRIVGQYKH